MIFKFSFLIQMILIYHIFIKKFDFKQMTYLLINNSGRLTLIHLFPKNLRLILISS